MVGVDVVDVQVRRLGGRFSGRRHGVKSYPGSAREGGDRLSTVADEMIVARDDAGERRANRGAVDLGQNGVEGRALPVPGDKDGNVVLMEARMSRRSAAFTRLARQIGPPALERLEDEGFVCFDDPS